MVENLNIHNHLSDPTRSLAFQALKSSIPYLEKAADAGFALLNPPGEYTKFPLAGKAHLLVIDLVFDNPHLRLLVRSWESSLPSTGSDHVPITIHLAPLLGTKPPAPRMGRYRRETLTPVIKNFIVPQPPLCPSPSKLDDWLSESLDRFTALLKEHTPNSRPSHHSKPW